VVVEVEGSVDAPQSHVTAVEASLPILVAPRADPTRTTPLNPNEAVTVAAPPRGQGGPVHRVAPDQARRAVEMAALPPHARQISEREVIHRERAEQLRMWLVRCRGVGLGRAVAGVRSPTAPSPRMRRPRAA